MLATAPRASSRLYTFLQLGVSHQIRGVGDGKGHVAFRDEFALALGGAAQLTERPTQL